MKGKYSNTTIRCLYFCFFIIKNSSQSKQLYEVATWENYPINIKNKYI